MKKSVIAAMMVFTNILFATIAFATQDACSTPEPNTKAAVTTGTQQAGLPPVVGEWEFRGHIRAQMSMVAMTITRDPNGKYDGKWSVWRGADSNLTDITYNNGKLNFVQIAGTGGQQFKVEYDVNVAGNILKGIGKNEAGEILVQGGLMTEPNAPQKTGPKAICGKWDLRTTTPDRDFMEKLIITQSKDGTLTGKWEGQRGGHTTIADVKYDGGKLTFTRIFKLGEREFKTTFEGTVEGDQLKGTFNSEAGSRATSANRVLAPTKPQEPKGAEPNKPLPEKKADSNKKPV